MRASPASLEKQRRLVETMRRQLLFELLLLRRMRHAIAGDESHEVASASGAISLRQVLERAADRQAERLLERSAADAGEVGVSR